MSFKFGLNVKNKGNTGLGKPGVKSMATKTKSLFDDEAEDATTTKKDGAQEIGGLTLDDSVTSMEGLSESKKPKVKKGQPPSAPPTRKAKARDDDPTALKNSASAKESERRAQEALKTDANIYDYDTAYDALHARAAAKKAEEQQDPSAPRQSQHMQSLFDSAEQRKKDQLRARDKLLQREREAEGDEFADKEKFVTGAYKAQQEEARQAEEEEKKRVEAEDARKKKEGMQGFHKRMLAEQEKRHQEAMEAAAEAAKEGYKPPVAASEEKTDAQIVEELRKQGKKVDLNEEGQIADKRQTLSAGLNIVAKPRPVVIAQAAQARPAAAQSAQQGNRSGRHAQRDRQTQMIAQQIEAAAKRKADEEAEEESKIQHAAKSQKTATDISSAKERYLQRKREAAAAKAASEGK